MPPEPVGVGQRAADLIETGEYLISLYKRLWMGGVVRDLAEAEAAWSSAKRLAALSPGMKE